MKMITRNIVCVALMFAASICFAQMYTVTDLGGLGGAFGQSYPRAGINMSGQVAGYSDVSIDPYRYHAFRTAPNSPIDPATDDLGTLGGENSYAGNINTIGQVVGFASTPDAQTHAFRTPPNKAINPITDDLGTLGGTWSQALGVNDIGQVVGASNIGQTAIYRAFRTAANSPIDSRTDDLGTLGGTYSTAWRINQFGQVVGYAAIAGDTAVHAFRTAPNSPINPATDDLGTLGGSYSEAVDVNAFGQVVGSAAIAGDITRHAFRTAPNSLINPATDDLGTLGPGFNFSEALDIDDYGQVVGWPAFLYSNGVMHNLNDFIPAASGWEISFATGINNTGQIVAQGRLNNSGESRALLLTPIYKAFVQKPINADGSRVFSAKRGVIPVKFRLMQYNEPTCPLLPATLAITKASGGTLAEVDESVYSTHADSGSTFRIDTTACQYVYSLAASALGRGTYRVDISINGIMVGHAVFALR